MLLHYEGENLGLGFPFGMCIEYADTKKSFAFFSEQGGMALYFLVTWWHSRTWGLACRRAKKAEQFGYIDRLSLSQVIGFVNYCPKVHPENHYSS